MAVAKYVNERFFDSERKAPDELKAMWYILGISFSQYSAQLRQDSLPLNRWQSTSEGLIGIVKSALESEHAISPATNRHIRTGEEFLTYYLSIGNQKIHDDLIKRGLGVSKEERAFPEVEPQYLDHFVRGFFDAQVLCSNQIVKKNNGYGTYMRHIQTLDVYFNVPFLKGLYAALVEHAHVKDGKKVKNSPLIFGGSDVKKIYGFIYRDWDFIQEKGLYLPQKKALFEVKYNIEKPPNHPIAMRAKRIEAAKKLLRLRLSGRKVSGTKVAVLLGFSTPSHFYASFKAVTGQTLGQFLREEAQKSVAR